MFRKVVHEKDRNTVSLSDGFTPLKFLPGTLMATEKLPTDLPPAFDPGLETNNRLKKAKASISKKFSWTRNDPLFEAKRLAYLLMVFGKDDEAIEVCQFLGQMEFQGYRLWTAVEFALALEARLQRLRGEKNLAAACVDRIRKAGFVKERLEGSMLDPNHALEIALDEKDEKRELPARLQHAAEIAFIIELGGSKKCPVKKLEGEWSKNLARLKVLAGV
jgi:hypothetical protein